MLLTKWLHDKLSCQVVMNGESEINSLKHILWFSLLCNNKNELSKDKKRNVYDFWETFIWLFLRNLDDFEKPWWFVSQSEKALDVSIIRKSFLVKRISCN